ncbi:hypothetical protein M431DRAFT_517628, partial [Trichoderma harzianum CBS 226.95]
CLVHLPSHCLSYSIHNNAGYCGTANDSFQWSPGVGPNAASPSPKKRAVSSRQIQTLPQKKKCKAATGNRAKSGLEAKTGDLDRHSL